MRLEALLIICRGDGTLLSILWRLLERFMTGGIISKCWEGLVHR
jgi:hypothetical protein